MIGGRGDDLLEGGEGADAFVFDQDGLGRDVLIDFAPGEDLVDLSGLGLEPGQLDTNGDGVIGAGDRGVSVDDGNLIASLRGDAIEVVGATSLALTDVLI